MSTQAVSNVSALPGVTTWNIDPSHSSAHFSVRHMMITNVRGEFQKLSGSVRFDPQHPDKTQINASIDVASINTREQQRDTHLKSADFFDVEKYPEISFVSRRTEPKGRGQFEVTGDLTIHGVTREVVLEVEGQTQEHKDPWGNTRIGASATTKLRRSEFGMTWNSVIEAGGVLVGDEISVTLDVSLIKQG